MPGPGKGMQGGLLRRAAAAGLGRAGRRRLAVSAGRLMLTGLEAPVEVVRDRWGIPHIFARSFADMVFAQGFVQAQDRLWQMDFQRRLVAGRVSEVCGPFTLSMDRWVRVLGLRVAAERDAERLRPAERELFEAFSQGVNRCMQGSGFAGGRLPLEFGLLRYEPYPWTVADSLSWAKLLAWMLSTNWETELLREELLLRVGPQLARQLEPDSAEDLPIVPGAGVSGVVRRARRGARFIGSGATGGVGSNSWAVSGAHTASGLPLLANDMHLALTIPAVWHQAHLSCPGVNAVGVSLPGLPCLVSGHNGGVCWGITAGMVDTQDLYRERIRRQRREDEVVVEWRYSGRWLPADVRRELIPVRGWRRPAVQEVIVTGHGPIINGLAPREAGELPLALRWTGHEPDNIPKVLREMLTAKDARSFRETLMAWGAPVVNMVFADASGDIAYQLTGRIPVRPQSGGLVPARGWTGESEWKGFIPFAELPSIWNPEAGFIVTANNRVAGPDYPYYLGNEFAVDDRARRITDLLHQAVARAHEGRSIDAADMRAVQLDQTCPGSRCLAGHLRRLAETYGEGAVDPLTRSALRLAADWDGSLAPDSCGAALGEMLVHEGLALLLGARLGPLLPRYKGRGPTPFLAEWGLFGEKARTWFHHLLEQPTSPWFGKDKRRDRFLLRALQRSALQLALRLGPDPRGWQWGRLHALTFHHPLGLTGFLSGVLGRGPFAAGGSEDTIWAVSSRGEWAARTRIGPPFRFVADLARGDRAWGCLAPGQSGQLGSPHYDDHIGPWFQGRYRPLLLRRSLVQAYAEGSLELVPCGEGFF